MGHWAWEKQLASYLLQPCLQAGHSSTSMGAKALPPTPPAPLPLTLPPTPTPHPYVNLHTHAQPVFPAACKSLLQPLFAAVLVAWLLRRQCGGLICGAACLDSLSSTSAAKHTRAHTHSPPHRHPPSCPPSKKTHCCAWRRCSSSFCWTTSSSLSSTGAPNSARCCVCF